MKRSTHKLTALLILLVLGWAPLAAQQSGEGPRLRKEIVKVMMDPRLPEKSVSRLRYSSVGREMVRTISK